jgi:nucleotide-binding universal stress UspA family protein
MANCYRDHDGGGKHVYTQGQCLQKENNRQTSPALSTNGGRKLDTTDGYLPEIGKETKRILVYLPRTSADVTLRAYGEYLSSLLQGQTTYRLERSGEDFSQLRRTTSDFDLVLYGEPEQSTLERVLFGSIGRRVASNAPATILVAQQPRWPIRRILLVIRVEASEELAVEWAGRLTRLSDAHLTILPLVPFQPLIYGSVSHLQVGIESLLTPSTPSGEQLRTFLNRLRQWQVNGTLRVRQGDPLWQICWEIDEGKYDLIIIGAEQHSRWRRWLFGELVGPVISRINRPLLIAGTKQLRIPRPDHQQKNKRGDI